MNELVAVDACSGRFTFPIIMLAMDKLIARGSSRQQLTWKFSLAQATQLVIAAICLTGELGNPAETYQGIGTELYEGAAKFERLGLFGLNFTVDRCLSNDSIEIWCGDQKTAEIVHLSIPAGYPLSWPPEV